MRLDCQANGKPMLPAGGIGSRRFVRPAFRFGVTLCAPVRWMAVGTQAVFEQAPAMTMEVGAR